MATNSELKPQPSDLLNVAFINSLPHPLYGIQWDGWLWPIHDICVGTGLVRIDVCGLLQTSHISDYSGIKDDAGVIHEMDDFYLECDSEAHHEE